MRGSLFCGALALGFVLACTGGDVPVSTPRPTPVQTAPSPPPVPPPVPADTDTDTDAKGGEAAPEPAATETEPGGGAAGEHWCCEYDGPLGKTQALIDAPKECTDQFGDKGGKFVQGPQCEEVCCTYPKDPADLSKGETSERVAFGNCSMRKGKVDAEACKATPPRPRAAPAPAPGRLTRPGTDDRSGGDRPAPRPGGSPSAPKPGRLTRPGG